VLAAALHEGRRGFGIVTVPGCGWPAPNVISRGRPPAGPEQGATAVNHRLAPSLACSRSVPCRRRRLRWREKPACGGRGRFGLVAVTVVLGAVRVAALAMQFKVRRYHTWIYRLAFAVASAAGTQAANGLHTVLGFSYVIAVAFWLVVPIVILCELACERGDAVAGRRLHLAAGTALLGCGRVRVRARRCRRPRER
jgi:hypothetical protein